MLLLWARNRATFSSIIISTPDAETKHQKSNNAPFLAKPRSPVD
jgi:hypothetical protein